MRHSDHRATRGSVSAGLRVTAQPNPFDPAIGFIVTVTGGIPPYTFSPVSEPPNPPGVIVTPIGPGEAQVMVPPGTPPGTWVYVDVQDSSVPPHSGQGRSSVQ